MPKRKLVWLDSGLQTSREVMSVRVAGGLGMFAGVKNAPGTHSAVFSDAFLSLRPLE